LNVVNTLIELGADPNKGDPLPIVSAVSLERKDMFDKLLEQGASLGGQSGAEAAKKSREEGLTSMLALLREYGVVTQETMV
jgi:hypothetical protein